MNYHTRQRKGFIGAKNMMEVILRRDESEFLVSVTKVTTQQYNCSGERVRRIQQRYYSGEK
jgi:hypothetical protein